MSGFRLSRHSARPIRVSFEFFPPKTAEMEATLWSSIERLAPLNPQFVSVTYGAGGSTRERTHATVARILGETHLKPAAHLTCVAATKDDVNEVLAGYECGVTLEGSSDVKPGDFLETYEVELRARTL